MNNIMWLWLCFEHP